MSIWRDSPPDFKMPPCPCTFCLYLFGKILGTGEGEEEMLRLLCRRPFAIATVSALLEDTGRSQLMGSPGVRSHGTASLAEIVPPLGTEESHAHSSAPSTDVQHAMGYDAEDFDELEAASQETHDLCYAMIAFLRRADPEATQALYWRRTRRGFRETVPEQHRRLLHGHGDKSKQRLNRFASAKDLEIASQLYLQWGEKLMLLLNKPLMDRLIHSAGKGCRDLRSDGVHKYKKPLERASWRTFPHRWFKHAPFEVQQLRADIPEAAVQNTRFYRDQGTLRCLFALMEPQHTYRSRIEQRMFEITAHYDPAGMPGEKQ